MCTENIISIITEKTAVLAKELFGEKLDSVVLYGSYARGDATDESDVDIMMTVDLDANGLRRSQRDLSKINSKLSLTHDITVSINAEPLTQFREYEDVLPYYRNVRKEGIRYEPTV